MNKDSKAARYMPKDTFGGATDLGRETARGLGDCHGKAAVVG